MINRIFLPILTLLIVQLSANAQVVSSDPALPMDTDAVTIFFDATQGTGGLAGYTGDVYAHTGVITDKSSSDTDWKYVIAGWSEDTEKALLTRISDDNYSLEIGPSIREFYGVPSGEEILKIAMVFRNSGGSKEGKDSGGKDIYVELLGDQVVATILTPAYTSLLEQGSSFDLEGVVSEEATINLYENDVLLETITGTSISKMFTYNDPGDFWIKMVATTSEETLADSVFVHVLGDQPVVTLPGGLLDGITYVDDNTAQLVLHAPGKEHVFAIGDFNGWIPNSTSRMNYDNGKYWITIDNLTAGVEYAFQYFIDGELRLADPYTEKVLDEGNDRWISASTYPNLKEFPSDKTTGRASVLETGQVPYGWTATNYVRPDQENLVIYETLVRDFIAAHDYKTLIDTLDYFSNLGINAIELMPINEFEGNESWGYNPSFYFAPDKYYGPKEDLKAFIDACHARGIAVIIDMVYNHSFSQSPLVQLYFDGATGKVTAENPWYNVDSPNQSYFWGYDFDHESSLTQEFFDRVSAHWITEYKVDGFRFDFTKGITNTPGDGWNYDAARIALLKRMADEIWEVDPGVYIILEHLTANSEEKVLADYGMMMWGNKNFNYNEATMGYNESGKSNFGDISHKARGWNDPHLVGYMESHDEERLMFKNLEYGNSSGDYNIKNLKTALMRVELAANFFIPIPGPKMIWQFGELGYDYSIDFNGRVGNKPIKWEYFEEGKRRRLYDVFAALNHLKLTEPAFTTDDFSLYTSSAAKRIELNHADMDVRIIGNFDVVSLSVDPNFSKTGTWYDFYTGESINVTDVNGLINLGPGEYRFYTTKQLNTPDITLSVPENRFEAGQLKIYPVPATDWLYIDTERSIQSVSVYDLQGRAVLQSPELRDRQIDSGGLAA